MIVSPWTGLGAVENDTWPSTGAINSETVSLDLQIKQLGSDYFNSSAIVDPTFERSWNTFVADWQNWMDTGYFWNPTRRDELLEYRKRFNNLRSMFQAAGVSTGTDAQAAAPTQESPLNQIAGILGKAGWVVGGVVLLWAANTIYKETRGR